MMLRRVASAASAPLRANASFSPWTSMVLGRNYHERVIDHYNNPRNMGSLDKADASVGTGLVGAPACGDVMKFQIKVDDNGKIVESCFKTFGCGSAIASSSLATEWVKVAFPVCCLSFLFVTFPSCLLPFLFLHSVGQDS